MMRPAVGRSRFISSLATVDLPQPDSPTIPSVSPGYRSKETPSTALTEPTCLRNTMPCVSGKCLARSRTSRIGSRVAGRSFTVGCGAVVTEGLLPEVAGARPLLAHPEQRRHIGPADVLRHRAARVERATRRDVQQVGRQPLDRVQLPALLVQP